MCGFVTAQAASLVRDGGVKRLGQLPRGVLLQLLDAPLDLALVALVVLNLKGAGLLDLLPLLVGEQATSAPRRAPHRRVHRSCEPETDVLVLRT